MGREHMPLGAEDDGSIIAYMCLIDFECEAGLAMGGNRIYYDVEDLRRNRPCVDSCGIVKVRLTRVETVQFSKDEDDTVG